MTRDSRGDAPADGTRKERVKPTAIIGAVVGVVGVLFGLFGMTNSLIANARANQLELEQARADVVANVLAMSEQADRSNPDAIVALAHQINAVVTRHGAAELDLAPTIYRQGAEHLTRQTSELDLADGMIKWAMERLAEQTGTEVSIQERACPYILGSVHAEAEADVLSLETLRAYRVQGDLSAQLQLPQAAEDCYEQALTVSEQYQGTNPLVRDEAAHFTRGYQVAGLLLGASRTEDPDKRQLFCTYADRAHKAAKREMRELEERKLIQEQLSRLDVKSFEDGLTSVCA